MAWYGSADGHPLTVVRSADDSAQARLPIRASATAVTLIFSRARTVIVTLAAGLLPRCDRGPGGRDCGGLLACP
jgi:hypothetical protein